MSARMTDNGYPFLVRMLSGLALAAILIGAEPALAFSLIHSHGPEPQNPDSALVSDGAGTLYGTTRYGGTADLGTVFSVKSDGTEFQQLHSFAGGASDGRHPGASLVLDGSGTLYGTTSQGGSSDVGTVFSVKTDGTSFQVLHSFAGASDGSYPYSSLVLDGSGTLFGMSLAGGTSNLGTVFSVKTDGTSFLVLRSFAGGAGDGQSPYATLILDGSGTLYGTTANGGTSNLGAVFSVKTDGTSFQMLHSFAGGASDGRLPYESLVLDGSGNLFGTTYFGGASDLGTVFSVKTDGTSFQVLHSFAGGAGDGQSPYASVILDGSGSLYGTTTSGGTSNLGTVFSVKTDGTSFQVLHSFAGGASDGANPFASLILDGNGSLFGTTYSGGTSDLGTVFSLKTDGTTYRVLPSFAGGASDGGNPYASLVLDASGTLFGTTKNGGPSNRGTVFSVKSNGTDFTTLHAFAGEASDGAYPGAGLVLDGSGNLYGTTGSGGTSGMGTVFRMKTDGTLFQLLHSFTGGVSDGQNPQAALILDGSGTLYGTTVGDWDGCWGGTVYSVKTDGSSFQMLHDFFGGASGGCHPWGSLVLDGTGTLYGTTETGGSSTWGTVYSVKTDGTSFQVLHSFAGGASDGLYPEASLVLDGSGNLYGTTYSGGASNLGTVFSMQTDGTSFQVLHSFWGGASDGAHPYSSLVRDGTGILYGTTYHGGPSDLGTVFIVRPDGTDFQLLHSFTGGTSDGANPYACLILDDFRNLYGTTTGGGMSGTGTEFSLPSLCLAPIQPRDFTASAATVCQGESNVTYTIPSDPSVTYNWSYSGTGGTITGSGNSVTVTFSPSATSGTLSVTATNVCGTGPARSLDVTVNPTPAAPTAGSEAAVCQGETINLTATTVSGATYSWTGPNGFTDTAQNPTIPNAQPAATGTYSVTATVGSCTSPAGTTTTTVTADSTAPGVTPPAELVISQTVCCGTFGGVFASDTAVAAFLAGATATDDCVATPTQLAPQIGIIDVIPSTCFEVGDTTVTFRFQDAVPNTGTATATVTVRMFGDLNLDLGIDAGDMVVLRAFINGVISPGTPPFNAPQTLADMSHDGGEDAGDMIVLRAFINGALICMGPP